MKKGLIVNKSHYIELLNYTIYRQTHVILYKKQLNL